VALVCQPVSGPAGAMDGQGTDVPLVRVISRLNVGGPSIQVISLTKLLGARGYSSTLVRGREGSNEGNMDHLAEEMGVQPVMLRGLRREVGLHDLVALVGLIRLFRRIRPRIVHTHAAKAGALGRIAALITPGVKPDAVVHTFHGHVFEGVFDSARAGKVAMWVERALSRLTTQFVAVSGEVRDDLVRYRVARPDQVEVVRLGFDLSRFKLGEEERERERTALRQELGIPADARVVSIVARVARMKRVDRFVRVAGRLADMQDVYFLIVGDGPKREEIERSPAARALGSRLIWAGLRSDIASVCAATDVMVLTSDNEGTPVAFIEAQAAGLPVVGTDVGGVTTVVEEGRTGRVLPREDENGLASAVRDLLDDPDMRSRMGEAGRIRAFREFGIDRLVDDIDGLYRRLLRGPGSDPNPVPRDRPELEAASR
jgi:glycosyltransferase involved in cell wall biosynthesis